ELERIHGTRIDLSELHTVYFAYVEKCERFVRLHGKAQFSQGGLCHDVIDVVAKHGVVPAESYSGLLDGERVHDHTELEQVLAAVIAPIAESQRPSEHWKGAVRGVLDAYMGAVPETVEVDGKTETPLEYAHEDLRIPVDDYVQLMSFESQPFWKQCQLLVPDNWQLCGDYWNVPIETMLANLDHALREGFTVAVDMDVSEPGTFNREHVWKMPDELEQDGAITDAMRQHWFDDRETTDDHLMHIVGISKDEDGRLFYLTKNSHGSGGPFAGHLYMSRNYVAAKMLSFMVHKDGLDPATLARTGGS
ncbi:MAG: aminopeptidase, partial [Planctomycetes bacterium]|nr:aminopeptidase [Planctomycetota bacterium]